jgi:hypothetical protein
MARGMSGAVLEMWRSHSVPEAYRVACRRHIASENLSNNSCGVGILPAFQRSYWRSLL